MPNKTIFALTFTIILVITTTVNANPIINIQHWYTNNKIPVYFVHSNYPTILDIQVIFAAGSINDGSLPGIATLTGKMLNEGTTKMNVEQIATYFDKLGAQFNITTNRDFTKLDVRILAHKDILNKAIRILNTIITSPSFPKANLQRIKHQMLANLTLEQQLPNIIANQTFYKILYAHSSYAHPILGTKSAIKKSTLKNINKFYQRYYNANNAALVLVGSINRYTAQLIAQKITKNLAVGKPTETIMTIPSIKQNHIKNIHFRGTQSYIRIGCLGIKYNNPYFFPLIVGNYILGGGILVSRLFQEVRQKHGLSYSVKSKLTFRKNQGAFLISLQTKNKSRKRAIAIAINTLHQFLINGPTLQELQAAKKNLIASFALKLNNNAKIANALSELAFYHLPLDFFTTYQQKISSVTQTQVKYAWKKIIGSQKLILVSVGNN